MSCFSDRPGLVSVQSAQKLNFELLRALRLKLECSHPVPVKGDVTAYQLLTSKVHSLRYLLFTLPHEKNAQK